MAYTTKVGKTAVSLTIHFLTHHWPEYTVSVHSVEDETAYQQHDVDLLWSIVDGNGRLVPIKTLIEEIESVRHHKKTNETSIQISSQ